MFDGVPMHWMSDWSTPCPLFVERAHGARFHDVDGHVYVDFCLGDTGSMFGHSPAPIARALAEQGANGLTTMLPGRMPSSQASCWRSASACRSWQVATTATDANRFVLRWARAITGRKVVLVFDGCYHGTVDDTLVRCPRRPHRASLRPARPGPRPHPVQPRGAVQRPPGPGQALASEDVAAVLCEPAMTNIGMVLPQPGFHQKLRELTVVTARC